MRRNPGHSPVRLFGATVRIRTGYPPNTCHKIYIQPPCSVLHNTRVTSVGTRSKVRLFKDKYQCNQYVFGTFLEGYSPNLRDRVIGYGRATEESYFDFLQGEEIILFCESSKPALGPTQPSMQLVR
jgi:hypothetical protein